MHEDLALIFAQWLSPDFYLWCNDRIKELLQYGMTATQPTLEQMINNPDLVICLATQLKNEREEKQRLALEIRQKEQEKQSIIEETRPAVVFTECVTSSSTNILIGDLAKLITQNGYKIGEIRLYEWMVENKYLIRKQRYSKSKNKYVNDYIPTQRTAEMGLFFVKERPIVSGGSPTFIKHTCYVTGKGQVYFLNKFKSLMAHDHGNKNE
ncbi:phage antirepressor KilAC domain-containing protein [Bacteroides fragilis]